MTNLKKTQSKNNVLFDGMRQEEIKHEYDMEMIRLGWTEDEIIFAEDMYCGYNNEEEFNKNKNNERSMQ